MKKKRICDHAVDVLRETGNPAVMWGDEGLLHMIAERAQTKTRRRAWKTSEAILDALSRCPGDLIPGKTRMGHRERGVRIFRLPETK